MSSSTGSVQSATKWSLITEFVVKFISPLTNMVLARLLTPNEFGVVATVTMIVSLTDIFTDAGFQKYIIQHQFKDEKDADESICVAFWSNLIMSLLLWGGIFIFSDKLATVVGNPGKGNVIFIGAAILPLTSFSSIQLAVFKKKLDFKSIAGARILVKLIPLLVVAPLAYIGFSYWALIIGDILSELVNAVFLTIKSEWKPKLYYDISKLKEMLSFCIWSMGESFSSWLVSNIGIFIIGTLFTEYYLGVYKTATTTVNQIISIITASTISVLLAGLSREQSHKEEYKKIYMNFLKGIGIFTIPLGVGLLMFDDVVCRILLGNQWGDATLIIGLWGFVLAESVIFNGMSGAVILSLGKPKELFISNIVQAILMVPAFYFGGKLGFKQMVIITSIVRVQLPAFQTFMACRLSKISFREIFAVIRKYCVASIMMGIFAIFVKKYCYNMFMSVFFVCICAVVYFMTLYCIPEGRCEINNYLFYFKLKFKGGKHE